jgi:hypothetical protein
MVRRYISLLSQEISSLLCLRIRIKFLLPPGELIVKLMRMLHGVVSFDMYLEHD